MARGEQVPQEAGRTPGTRIVTPAWLSERRAAVAALRAERENSPAADTKLLIPAAQHPLVGGRVPGREFEVFRLEPALAKYRRIAQRGGKAEIFLTGNRHHDSATGQTDDVALYDASGLWFLRHGVPANALHGKDWLDAYDRHQYNGAAEIEVASLGFRDNPRFSDATYFCSPGQAKRAEMYALAYGMPLTVTVPEGLGTGQQASQFHAPSLQQFALAAMTRTIDPYGARLAKMTTDRIPADGNVGTVPDLLDNYAGLPWYNSATS